MPIGVKYHIPMMQFYQMNPRMIERYQPYMNEWLEQHMGEYSTAGWANGLYVARVIGSLGKGGESYPESPLDLIDHGSDEEEETYTFTDADKFGAWAAAFNKQFEGRRDATVPAEGETADTPNNEPSLTGGS